MQKNNQESHGRASLRNQSNERGVALIAVMLTLMLITAIAAGIIILTNTETNTSSNFKDEQRAFFSAKSGIEEARDRLRKAVTNYTITRPTTLPGSGSTGVLYILNPLNSETVAPWCASSASSCKYPDDELCNEQLSGTSVSCSIPSGGTKSLPSGSYYTTTTASSTLAPSSGSVLDWKWTRVTLKQNNAFGSGYYVNGNSASTGQVFWSGTSECLSGQGGCATTALPVFVITSLAVTPSGSRRMVQMEVAEDQLTFAAPAALTLDGKNDTFSGGNSSNYTVTGVDQGGCGSAPSSSTVPAIGVPNTNTTDMNTDITNIVSGIPSNRTGNYTGSGSTTPDVEGVSMPSTMIDPTSLQTFVSQLKNDVTQPVINCPSGCSGLSNPGSSGSPQIIYVNGALTMSGNTVGTGILVVTGDLTFKGTVEWDGLVLVVGTGNFTMSGNNTFKGAVVVANTLNSSGGTLSVLGAATGNVNGGGNSNGGIFYSASCLGQATQLSTFHSVSFRELMN
jgi:autotransporter-associated beta strand protein